MTFVAGFYSYNLKIADPENSRYESVRVKVPRHPEESSEFLFARVLAYAHSYRPGLEFSEGFFDPKAPTILAKDFLGAVVRWINVGAPDRDKIQRALRHSKNAEFRIYFLSESEAKQFANYLRGSTTNWVAGISFFQFDQEFLDRSEKLLKSSSTWEITFTEEAIYLDIDGTEIETRLQPINIWEEYQDTIQNNRAR